MKISNQTLVVGGLIVVALVILIMCLKSRERYHSRDGYSSGFELPRMESDEGRLPIDVNARFEKPELPSFLKSTQFFQGTSPTMRVENDYHRYIKEDCGGNYQDYKCRQKAYIKAMKNGTFDRTDLICSRYEDDEDKYYQCLDAVYGDYKWMDRFTGAAPCKCPGLLGQGASGPDGCFCPTGRTLRDRRPTDEYHQPVEYVYTNAA